jgi:hypothetical protein
MTHDDLENFSSLLVGVGELYGKIISSALVEIYWEALFDYDIELIRESFSRHVKNSESGQFMPKPADIIKFIDGLPEEKALLAWSKVERNRNSYESYVFDDAIIHSVIQDMGGWVRVCEVNLDQLSFLQNEFVKRYKGYFFRKSFSHPKFLAGRIETSNPTTARGCDEEKCKKVYSIGHDKKDAQKSINSLFSSLKLSNDGRDGENNPHNLDDVCQG